MDIFTPFYLTSSCLTKSLLNLIRFIFSLFCRKFHFSNVSDKDDRYLPPMAVGAMTYGMTTLEMTAAYASFGNGGKYYEPYCFYKVTNSDGSEVILEHKEHSEQILSPATADVMCELLQTVKTSTYGTGSNVRKFQIM